MNQEEILQEVQRIKYLYKMKGVFRFGQDRDPWERAESNAEHLYGMMVLTNYFLPREDPEGAMSRQRIFDLLFVHDLDEIESGDIISYEKTAADRVREAEDMQIALKKSPSDMAFDMAELVREYEAQETPEARFTKAIDKIEPLFEVFDKYGKHIMQSNQTTYEQAMHNKEQYLKDYPILNKFLHTIGEEMNKQGYFYEDSN